MPILLSDEEIEALEGLPHLHRCLYIFGIRRHMDYQTGITGVKRKISYKSLSEEVYIEPHQGLKNTGEKSREAIRRAVKMLERAGLIIIQSNAKNLILKCNLAIRDKSVQNKPDTNPTPQLTTQADTKETQEKPIEINANQATDNIKPDTQADTPKNEKADTHPLSDTLHNITLPNAQDFFSLLARQGYYLNQLQDNKSTRAMVHQWVQARITLEEARIGINHANAQKPPKPDSPTYYLKPVLQVRQDFENAQKKANEVKDDRRQIQQSTQTTPQRYPKSATRQFWERQEAILRDIAEDEN